MNLSILVKKIVKERQAYIGGNTGISREEYDDLHKQLQSLDPNHPVLYFVHPKTADWWIKHYETLEEIFELLNNKAVK